MDDTKTINSREFLKILSDYLGFKVKYNRFNVYVRNNLFPFIENKVGEGNERRFTFRDTVCMVAAVKLYLDHEKNLNQVRIYANLIHHEFPTYKNHRELFLVVNKSFEEPAYFVGNPKTILDLLSSNKIDNGIWIFPFHLLRDKVKKLWEKV